MKNLYKFRFELFFFSLSFILFGAVFFPIDWFEDTLIPILFLINITSGILLISRNKKIVLVLCFLLVVVLFLFIRKLLIKTEDSSSQYLRFFTYFMFYSIVTFELIKQVWKATFVSKNVIIGVMCGYISLGLIFFFIFLTIEMYLPNSFNGLDSNVNSEKVSQLQYYTYITLLTIGYGEITPNNIVAQKAAILTGLAGQFYLVILTAIIVGKYINQDLKKINNP